ncbi:MAG: hypothetical protein J5896_06115, partial [Alphaproteobacteria bacterium]|nr:hypothetical protein [Alphaproteobacteria bacterium]
EEIFHTEKLDSAGKPYLSSESIKTPEGQEFSRVYNLDSAGKPYLSSESIKTPEGQEFSRVYNLDSAGKPYLSIELANTRTYRVRRLWKEGSAQPDREAKSGAVPNNLDELIKTEMEKLKKYFDMYECGIISKISPIVKDAMKRVEGQKQKLHDRMEESTKTESGNGMEENSKATVKTALNVKDIKGIKDGIIKNR